MSPSFTMSISNTGIELKSCITKFKIILCVPNFRWVEGADPNTLWHYLPYNLCLLASMVRDICDVKIIDANQENLSEGEFVGRMSTNNPDIVGITILMDEYGEAGHICAKLVKSATHAIVVMGGVYASMNAEEVAKDNNIDYIIKGEGEYSFKDLLTKLLNEGAFPYKIIDAERIKNLDALPLPAYDLIDFNKYSNNAERKSVDAPRKYPYARIITSRGCPFNCIFCQVGQISGKRFRERSADNVLNEIQLLKDKYGIKSIIFDDDNLLFDRGRAIKIFQGMIDKNLAMPWVMIATAVFELDEELIKLMKTSGCEYIDVAIESGTERVLRQIINKPLDFEYAKKMIKFAKNIGIFVTANLIVGFPTETWAEIRQTLKFADEMDADYTKISTAIPLRNTRLWDMCEKENAFKKEFDKDNIKWSTGQIETDEFSANELTILRAFEWDRINFTDPNKLKNICKMMDISELEIDCIRKKTLLNAINLIKNGIPTKTLEEFRSQ